MQTRRTHPGCPPLGSLLAVQATSMCRRKALGRTGQFVAAARTTGRACLPAIEVAWRLLEPYPSPEDTFTRRRWRRRWATATTGCARSRSACWARRCPRRPRCAPRARRRGRVRTRQCGARGAGAHGGWDCAPCAPAPAAGVKGCLLRSAPAGLSLGVAPHGEYDLCATDHVRV